jgi:heterotetrameric sarcosine oxidase delta subunit
MAFRIHCPHCGPRPYTEFAFGGELADGIGDEHTGLDEDFERVWLRRNDAGPALERWFHATGCRRWLTLERDTATNEVHGIR